MIRQRYRPQHVTFLLIAESPPPEVHVQSSRHFYRTDQSRRDDRLFNNTIRALYPTAAHLSDSELQAQKESWLHRFQNDGCYMIEALEVSQVHEITKSQRQDAIRTQLPRLIERVSAIAQPDTKIILIKSNVFEIAAEALRQSGFSVLNTELVDYPGHYNQQAYRRKLAKLMGSMR